MSPSPFLAHPAPRLRWGLTLLLGLAAVLGFTTGFVRAELIINGGFESPALPPGTGFLTVGNPGLPGWTIFGPGGGRVDVILNYWPPAQGLQSLDLVGDTGFGTGILQTFATTPGEQYLLSFRYANNVDTTFATGRVELLGGTTLLNELVTHAGSTRANMNYLDFEALFTANSPTTTLRFTHVAAGPPAPAFTGLALDSVSVTLIPEPGSLALLGVGVLGVVGYGRWRRRWRSTSPAQAG